MQLIVHARDYPYGMVAVVLDQIFIATDAILMAVYIFINFLFTISGIPLSLAP